MVILHVFVQILHNVDCNSYLSCQYANIITNNDVDCDGLNSCSQSTIIAGDSVLITGKLGGYYTDITAKTVIVYGSYGLHYSNIYQIVNKSLTVSLYGYLSGYHTDIYCSDGSQTCKVKCNINLACNSTKIYYSNLDNVNIEPSTCKNNSGTTNDNGILCPYLIESS